MKKMKKTNKMDQNDKKEATEKKVQKYSSQYMSIGMCFGMSIGLAFGQLWYPDNIAMGMCMGLPIGMCIGMVIGAAKDKRLSEYMQTVSRIEDVPESADKLVCAVDEEGAEKEYRVSKKVMKEQKFAVGNRVAEETDGSLVSLEEE